MMKGLKHTAATDRGANLTQGTDIGGCLYQLKACPNPETTNMPHMTACCCAHRDLAGPWGWGT